MIGQLSIAQITTFLQKDGYLLSSKLTQDAQSNFLSRTWIWLKKQLGFAQEYHFSSVAISILKNFTEYTLTDAPTLASACKMLILLHKRAKRSNSVAKTPLLIDRIEQKINELHLFQKKIWSTQLKTEGLQLEKACAHMQDDEELVQIAVECDAKALKFASPALLSNKSFILNFFSPASALPTSLAMAHSHLEPHTEPELQVANHHLQNDKDVVLAAVKRNGSNLQFATASLKENQEIALEAVMQSEKALDFIGPILKKSPLFWLALISKKGALTFSLGKMHGISSFTSNREFMRAAVGIHPESMQSAHDQLKGDKNFVLEALKAFATPLNHLPELFYDDEEIVFEAYKTDGNCLAYASIKLKSNPAWMLQLLKWHLGARHLAAYPSPLFAASAQLLNDPRFMIEAIKLDASAITHINEELKASKPFMLQLVQLQPLLLNQASLTLKNNFELVDAAVKQNGEALAFADDSLKNNISIVVAATIQTHRAWQHASALLKANRFFWLALIKRDCDTAFLDGNPHGIKDFMDERFMLEALSYNKETTAYISEELLNTESFVLKAIKIDAKVMTSVSSELWENSHFILKAVSVNGEVLQYVKTSLKVDKTIVFAAYQNLATSFNAAGPSLKNDPQFLLSLLQWRIDNRKSGSHLCCLAYAPPLLLADKAFMLQAMAIDADASRYLPKALSSNKDFILQVMAVNAEALFGASRELRADREVVFAAVKQAGHALLDADPKFLADEELVTIAAVDKGWILKYVSRDLQNNKTLVLAVVSKQGKALAHASSTLQDNEEVALAAISNDLDAFKSISKRLQEDKAFALKAIRKHKFYLSYLSQVLQADIELQAAAAIDPKSLAFTK